MSDQQKPWGSDEEFDAEKAWTLIRNLREDVRQAKADKDAVVQERDAVVRERDQAVTRVAEFEQAGSVAADEKKAVEDQLRDERTLRAKEHLLVDAGLPRDLAQNLTGDEEAWKNTVERFVALRGEVTQDRRPDPAQAAAPQLDEREVLAKSIFGD